MNKRVYLILFVFVASFTGVLAQVKVSGTVTDPEGITIPGVTVVELGTTNGTTTDVDGNYAVILSSASAVLQYSFVGLTSISEAINGRAIIDVKMAEEIMGIHEVVVTALGIKREKKMLTYASQQVSGTELRKAANGNFMEALSGRAAGIDIKTSNSGAGGSTKAVLRGNKSLVGLSEPLYVIDGIPMVNNKGSQPGSYGGNDGGDGLSQINPADIESLNILKGANASILYGSQGANGVILITTKKGKAGNTAVSVNSSTMFESVASLPDFQFDYGANNGSDYSWSTTKGNYQRNYIKDFFKVGVTEMNTVSISGGNDKTTVYFSYANTSAKGVMPTNTYQKHNFTLSQSTKFLNDKITISSNVMLANEVSNNRPGAGYFNNPLTGLYLVSRERDFAAYKTNFAIFNKDRNMDVMNWYTGDEKQNNPYWELYKDPKVAKTNRLIASLKASWDIATHLKLEVRGNIDYANKLNDKRYAAGGNPVSVSPNGTWSYSKYTDQSVYTDGILSYSTNFGDFSLNTILGTSFQQNTFNDGMSVDNGTISLMYPNFFSFENMPFNIMFNQSISKVMKQGVFANGQIGYKEKLFLDISARNDWASTLALTGNQSYLYPAVGLSAIISQMVDLPESISFVKLRASSSQTANEVPYNVVNPQNRIGGAGSPGGIGGISRNTQVPFTNLKPEVITSNEIGTEWRFLQGRAGMEFTYYSDVSTNQFLTLSAPSGSGYTYYYVNAGKITNKGFELTIDTEPIKTTHFEWKSSLNLSQNKNKIIELIKSNPDYQVGAEDEGFISIIKSGGSFNDLYIYKFARNEAGQIILDANGEPTKAAAKVKVGNLNPDLLIGWNNTFTYKDFYSSVLVNAKIGGIAFSKTEAFLDSYGVSKRSGDARANSTIPINAVQGSTSVTSIDPVKYYRKIGDRNGIMEPYVYSRTNVRLAQLVIGYNLDVRKLGLPIKQASFSLIGRNLFFFFKEAPFDPEQSMSTDNSNQSNDVFGVPNTRTYGFNLKVKF